MQSVTLKSLSTDISEEKWQEIRNIKHIDKPKHKPTYSLINAKDNGIPSDDLFHYNMGYNKLPWPWGGKPRPKPNVYYHCGLLDAGEVLPDKTIRKYKKHLVALLMKFCSTIEQIDPILPYLHHGKKYRVRRLDMDMFAHAYTTSNIVLDTVRQPVICRTKEEYDMLLKTDSLSVWIINISFKNIGQYIITGAIVIDYYPHIVRVLLRENPEMLIQSRILHREQSNIVLLRDILCSSNMEVIRDLLDNAIIPETLHSQLMKYSKSYSEEVNELLS